MQQALNFSLNQAETRRGLRLVAEVDQQIVACGQLLKWMDGAEIADVVVAEPCRGRGIGQLLVQALLSEAATLGYPAVEIGVEAGNEIALCLYQKLGFIHRRTVTVTWQGRESVYIYLKQSLNGGNRASAKEEIK